MLTRERESGRVKCHKYWPSTGAQTFSNLQVILHAVNEYPDYTLREFKIVDTKVSESIDVHVLILSFWCCTTLYLEVEEVGHKRM